MKVLTIMKAMAALAALAVVPSAGVAAMPNPATMILQWVESVHTAAVAAAVAEMPMQLHSVAYTVEMAVIIPLYLNAVLNHMAAKDRTTITIQKKDAAAAVVVTEPMAATVGLTIQIIRCHVTAQPAAVVVVGKAATVAALYLIAVTVAEAAAMGQRKLLVMAYPTTIQLMRMEVKATALAAVEAITRAAPARPASAS